MIKLNDVRVLRNILGDKKEDDGEYTLPKYNPKKLDFKLNMPNIPKAFNISKDKWSWNAKLGKMEIYDVEPGPELETYTPESKKGRPKEEIELPKPRSTAKIKSEVESRPEVIERLERMREKAALREIQEAERKERAAMRAEREAQQLEREQSSEGMLKMLERRSAREDRRMKALERKPSALLSQQVALRQAEAKNLAEQRLLSLAEQGFAETEMEISQRKAKAEIQRQKNAEQIGQLRFEQSRIGKFISPKSPWVKTAGRVLENVGQNLGGSFVGPYTDPGASKNLNTALLNKKAYMDILVRRYAAKKPPITIRTEADIMAIGTATERKRLSDLNRGVERAQTGVASTGFMGGSSASAVMGRLRRPANIQPFTQIGGSSQEFGSFTPEAFSRLGVSQSLTAIRPENKWDTLLGRGGGTTDRITRILGKKPDPEGPFNKLKRFL